MQNTCNTKELLQLTVNQYITSHKSLVQDLVSLAVSQKDLSVFDQLIDDVCKKVIEKHPELGSDIAAWVGNDIEVLKEELEEVTGTSISEKWFYTHVKNKSDKLPRIDTLDILSQFLGFSGWKDYQYQKQQSSGTKPDSSSSKAGMGKIVTILAVILGIGAVGYMLSRLETTPKFQFCFIDKNTRQPIIDTLVQVNLVIEGESSKTFTIRNQCFSGEGSYIEFEVKGKYYKPYQVVRSINMDNYYEEIALVPDDFALAIHLFSKQNLSDWKKRKQQLTEMIHPNARIYQVNEQEIGVDIYNKEEFINRLMLPTTGLKNIEILETTYLEGKIYEMRILRK